MTAKLPIYLTEWQRASAESLSELQGVFLDDDPVIHRVAQNLTRAGMLEVLELRHGLSIGATSYIGRISLGRLQVTVAPKIGIPVLSMIRYALNLRQLVHLSPVSYATVQDSFVDLLIRQLYAEVVDLLARGLCRQYARIDEDLALPRGRINFQQLVHQRSVAQTTLPCIHYPRIEDVMVNQVVLAGLHLAMRLTNDLLLRRQLQRVAGLLREQVTPVQLTLAVFRRLDREMNRLVAAYQPVLKLVRLLYDGQSINFDAGPDGVRLPGFLFDMNRLFQAIVTRFLAENLAEHTIRAEYRLKGMMGYAPAYNPRNRRAPEPRPDIIVLHGGRVASILDVKYIDLWERALSRDVLYQLAVYALSQEATGTSVILYPTVASEARDACIDVRDPLYERTLARIIIRPVHLARLEPLLHDAQTSTAIAERATFAHTLVFGTPSESVTL